uniref:Uncharacterized protein n=1 Tax=Mus spicilegus TaxID=10103 RepID=A0A8C6HYH6_MUSSI
MLMREVKYFKQKRIMSMTYYVRENGKCQLHTIWADKTPWKYCSINRNIFFSKCPKRNGTHYIPSTWIVQDAAHHFPIYFYPREEGGLPRRQSAFFIAIHSFSNTTILFEAWFVNYLNYSVKLAGALATGTNITKEMWDEYVKIIEYVEIPTENIENIYETGKLIPVKVS